MTREIPKFIHELLAAPPRAGEGVHAWLFGVARQLHAHLAAGEIVNLLESCVANCGRHVPRQEIISAVQNSLPCAWQPKGNAAPVQSAKKWPGVNTEQREAIVRDGGLADLWELSRPRIGGTENLPRVIPRNSANDWRKNFMNIDYPQPFRFTKENARENAAKSWQARRERKAKLEAEARQGRQPRCKANVLH